LHYALKEVTHDDPISGISARAEAFLIHSFKGLVRLKTQRCGFMGSMRKKELKESAQNNFFASLNVRQT